MSKHQLSVYSESEQNWYGVCLIDVIEIILAALH